MVPRYYFHVHDDIETHDEEGVTLPNLTAAREIAIKAARGLMAESVLTGRLRLSDRVEVENGQGEPVLIVHFREALEVTP